MQRVVKIIVTVTKMYAVCITGFVPVLPTVVFEVEPGSTNNGFPGR
jgi:hypothetical protein